MKFKKRIIGLVTGIVVLMGGYSLITFVNEEIPTAPEVMVQDTVRAYGLPVDSFSIVTNTVTKNTNMGNILSSFGVNYGLIDRLSGDYINVFDVRKIKTGNKYTAFLSKDSTKNLQYFVYEKSPLEYVVCDFRDSLHVYSGKKAVKTVRRTVEGVINSSLWNTMNDLNLDPTLAIELSDVYAWSIDFFGIAKGDKFQVVFNELYVDSTFIGYGAIEAAKFEHAGKDYWAYRFTQNGETSYFDEKGLSLKKAFLKAPLKYARISSTFTASRFHPVLKIFRAHFGVDYAAAAGTPVQTIGSGVVVEKGYQAAGGGNYLKIKHNSVYSTVYMHLKGFAPGVTTGKSVTQGDVIGYVGSTGLATGPHLDFRVYKNGLPVNPLKMEAPSVEPVNTKHMALYKTVMDSMTLVLSKPDNIPGVNTGKVLASK